MVATSLLSETEPADDRAKVILDLAAKLPLTQFSHRPYKNHSDLSVGLENTFPLSYSPGHAGHAYLCCVSVYTSRRRLSVFTFLYPGF
jgi:hypothetical protein